MQENNEFINTGTYKEFLADTIKILSRPEQTRDMLIKYLAVYYCSNNMGKVIERDVFKLLLCDKEIIDRVPENNVTVVEMNIYSTLTFYLKDKKFYKMAEQRGLV